MTVLTLLVSYADTWDTLSDVFEQLEAEKILPGRK
jgi:hypothetical protein